MAREFAHHKYTWSKPFGSVRHNWELVGPHGALNFHVTIIEPRDGYAPEPSAGLEFHHREPITPGDPPNQLQCHLTGGWCWHDGTSLYAQEHVWPAVEGYLLRGNHEGIFGLLEYELTRHFERLAEDKEAQ